MNIIQSRVCDALARHHKIKRAIVSDMIKDSFSNVGENPVLDLEITKNIRIGTTKETIPLGKMFFYNLFIRSALYVEAINLFEASSVDCVAFYSGGATMMISEGYEYNGVGGIFLRSSDKKNGYIIEPIAHYLEREYPVYSVE
jgi:hypothetical protein